MLLKRRFKLLVKLQSLKRERCFGDFIWEDKNVNGLQDGDESGVSGVTVELLRDGNTTEIVDVQGNTIEPIITNTDGQYKFCNLVPAQYSVRITLPKTDENEQGSWYITKANVGDDDSKDSDIEPATLTSSIIEIESGDKNDTIDGRII